MLDNDSSHLDVNNKHHSSISHFDQNAELIKPKRKSIKQKLICDWLPPIVVLLLLIIGLEICTDGLHLFKEMVMPSPSSILISTINFFKLKVGDYQSTFSNVFIGYCISVPLGLIIAGLLAQTKVLVKAFGPLIVVFAVTPMMVLVPILVMWTNFASWTRILAVVIQTVPIIVLNSLAGFTNVPAEKEELARLYGASKSKRFFKIVVPQAWPRIFTGLRMGVVNASLGIISTEFLILGKGMGYRITVACNFLKFPLVFGCIILVALTSYLLMTIVSIVEKRVLVWKQ